MYINDIDAPLSIAVWLATDEYDHNPDPNVLSATSFLKPLKAVILSKRLTGEETVDISSKIASRIGVALHNSIEKAWKLQSLPATLAALNFPEDIIDKIVINPKTLNKGDIPIYIERRKNKIINNMTISGQLDFSMQGKLEDFKSTSVWSWIFGSNETDYIIQGSIYKWLHNDVITNDHMAINYIFTDWSKSESLKKKDYPKSKILSKNYLLKSESEIVNFLSDRIDKYKYYLDKSENEIPACTDTELWKRETTYKYYKNPIKKTKSTKNFTDKNAAYARLVEDNNVGEIIEVPGEVNRCKYCNAFNICTQKDIYLADGTLKI